MRWLYEYARQRGLTTGRVRTDLRVPLKPDRIWLCEACVSARSTPGDCPRHPDEPLLDTRREDVVRYLAGQEDRALEETINRWMLLLGLPGALVTVVLFWWAPGLRDMGALLLLPPVLGAVSGLAVGVQRFRPRFDTWTRPPAAISKGDRSPN